MREKRGGPSTSTTVTRNQITDFPINSIGNNSGDRLSAYKKCLELIRNCVCIDTVDSLESYLLQDIDRDIRIQTALEEL